MADGDQPAGDPVNGVGRAEREHNVYTAGFTASRTPVIRAWLDQLDADAAEVQKNGPPAARPVVDGRDSCAEVPGVEGVQPLELRGPYDQPVDPRDRSAF